MEGIIKIVDHYMNKISPHTPTHLKDSQSPIDELQVLYFLPKHNTLFRADATSMYINIGPEVGIDVITQ
jgi:hypothetical protein